MLAVVLVVGAAPAVVALANYAVPIQDEVPVTTDETPTIVLAAPDGADVNMVDIWNGSSLEITTSQGNITVTGDPGASARLAVSDIEGSQTQVTEISAGSAWLELDPADKPRVDVRGDADSIAFSDVPAGVNDGSTDLQITGTTGGTAEVRLHGLSGNTEYALYDASRDEVLGHFTTDSTGTGSTTVELPDGSHALRVRTADTFDSPTVSNPDPEGKITETPDQLSVDVTADAWPVTVEFTLEGEVVGTKEVTSNGTVTTSVNVDELGTKNWSATATDGVNDTASVQTSFETPSQLTIREEHAPQTLVNGSTVTLRFYTVNGDVAIQRETNDANVSLEGLPATEFIVYVEADGYYSRQIYVESIFQQQNLYLLNSTEFPRNDSTGTYEAINSRFVYEDLTGSFPNSDTTIQIQRAIDQNGDGTSEFMTISGGYWGASNEYGATLEQGVRYRIVLVNRETGSRTVVGSHIPTEDRTIPIRVTGLVERAANASGIVGLAELQNGSIEIAYRDPEDGTTDLRVIVEARSGNTELYNETVAGPLGTFSTTLELNETQQDMNWVVRFDAGDRHQSAIPVGQGSIGLPVAVPGWLLTLLLSMAVTFVGALYGPRTALMGAWAMVFVAAGVAMFGWAFGGPAVLVAALVAVGMTLLSRGLP